MRWRLNKLDWPYALGELIIVTVGVLIALAIDQWNSDRLARMEEAEVIERLIFDMQADVRSLENGLTLLDRKEASLRRLTSTLGNTNNRPEDATEFLSDVIYAAQYGWVQGGVRRSTFDELLGSGKFSLIQDTELRGAITSYYALYESSWTRIDERETEYPHLSYRLVPRVDEFDLKPGLSDSDLDQLVTGVLESSIRDYVMAEENLALFTRRMINVMQPESLQTLGELEAYRDAIR